VNTDIINVYHIKLP